MRPSDTRAVRPIGWGLRLAVVLLAGCSGPPPPAPPAPTLAELTLRAAAGANPTEAGAGAPVELRVYQLGASSLFEGAEFYRLYENDTATLGADLVRKDTVLLAPGSQRTLALSPSDQVRAIGVLAGLRDFRHATWRAVAALPPHRTSTLAIAVDAAGVSIVAGP